MIVNIIINTELIVFKAHLKGSNTTIYKYYLLFLVYLTSLFFFLICLKVNLFFLPS